MHYLQVEQIARQRTAEIRKSAESGRVLDTGRGPRVTIRHRAGRALAAVGLRSA
jgi:hypothetical protein